MGQFILLILCSLASDDTRPKAAAQTWWKKRKNDGKQPEFSYRYDQGILLKKLSLYMQCFVINMH